MRIRYDDKWYVTTVYRLIAVYLSPYMYVSCFLNLSIILDISIWYVHLMNESLAVRLSVINIHTQCTMH